MMDIYFEPVNLNHWDMFNVISGRGHIETLLATKSMSLGDLVLIHVGAQNSQFASGIYAYGTVVKEPYIYQDSRDAHCYNRCSVDVRIDYINEVAPIITHYEIAHYVRQFRTVHKIDSIYYDNILNAINYNKTIEFLNPTFLEGEIKTVETTIYERDKNARKKCIEFYLLKNNGKLFCEICGFDFGKVYGERYRNMIEIHHIEPLHKIKAEYKVDPIKDLIPVCPNCHMVLHAKEGESIEELKNRFIKL